MTCLRVLGKNQGTPKERVQLKKDQRLSVIDPHQQTGTPISSSLAMSNIHLASTAQLYAASNSIYHMNISRSSASSPIQSSCLSSNPVAPSTSIIPAVQNQLQVNSPFASTSRVYATIIPNRSPANISSDLFQVKFLTPSIKVCGGCKKGYNRAADGKSSLPPPHDLCLVRKEQHLYYNVVYGKQQLSSLSNVHYHNYE